MKKKIKHWHILQNDPQIDFQQKTNDNPREEGP